CHTGNLGSSVPRTQKDRLQLAAGRHGLQLNKSRPCLALGNNVYWLRSLEDISQVIVLRPGAGFVLVKIPAYAIRKEAAMWSSLDEIERVLIGWRHRAAGTSGPNHFLSKRNALLIGHSYAKGVSTTRPCA